ncbi:MAG: hypothetical protein AAB856_03770 [Patescibacteria group bacterium]
MTKIFYWHLIELSPLKTELVNRGIGDTDLTEILDHVEEIIHHRTLSLVYDNLPAKHHREFSYKLAKEPHKREIMVFLQQKSGVDIAELLAENIRLTINEILEELRIIG